MKKRQFATFVSTALIAVIMLGSSITVYAAVPGIPRSPEQQVPQQAQPQQAPAANASYIGEAQAKPIALSAFSFTESDVSNIRVTLKNQRKPNKAAYYCVKFNDGLTKYEVEIRATDGAIIEIEVDYKNAVTRPTSGNYIGQTGAETLAFNILGISRSDAANLRTQLKTKKNGTAYFEVKFFVGQIKYEYEFDAYNGTALEVEICYKKVLGMK